MLPGTFGFFCEDVFLSIKDEEALFAVVKIFFVTSVDFVAIDLLVSEVECVPLRVIAVLGVDIDTCALLCEDTSV